MKIRTMTFATVASFALASPMVMAADDMSSDPMSEEMQGASMEAPHFEQLDSNGDGMISAEELNVYGSTAAGQAAEAAGETLQLDQLDADGDGSISMEEFEQGQPME